MSESQFLAGKSVFLTGGSRETGPHIARAFAAVGANVFFTYLTAKKAADQVVKEVEAFGVKGAARKMDLRESTEVRKVFAAAEKKMQGIDILVNNAGTWTMQPLIGIEEKTWDSLMDGNPKGAFLLTQLAAKNMKKRGWGRVVMISATSAYKREHSIYGLAKATQIRLTQALSIDLGPEVAINCLIPGLIDHDEINSKLKRERLKVTPLKRLVTRDEIAKMAVALCTPLFDCMTGEAFVMDGGMVSALR